MRSLTVEGSGLQVAGHHQHVCALRPLECIAHGAAQERTDLLANLDQAGILPHQALRNRPSLRSRLRTDDDQDFANRIGIFIPQYFDRTLQGFGFVDDRQNDGDRHGRRDFCGTRNLVQFGRVFFRHSHPSFRWLDTDEAKNRTFWL